MAKITIIAQGGEECVVEIGERLTIGRSTRNALVLDDFKASRNHAEISHIGRGRYRLSDIGSANGTWVNGRRMTTPRELQNGDEIQIGGTRMHFEVDETEAMSPYVSASTGTKLEIRNELVVVLVADIRAFTTMSEALPSDSFSQLITEWFGITSEIIDTNGGIVDKFIGDAVMAYWIANDRSNPANEVNGALKTARAFVQSARRFSDRLSARFAGYTFGIGVGINIGNATLCNMGTAEHQSFTAAGDTVNVAFRLEPLTKTKCHAVIVNNDIAAWASSEFHFQDLGSVEVKGRRQPVSILGLKIVQEP